MRKNPSESAGRIWFRTGSQRQLVQVLRANGIAHHTIAANPGRDVKTPKRHFKDELADGHAQVEAALDAVIVRACLAGNVYAARNWLSTHGFPEWRISEKREIRDKLELKRHTSRIRNASLTHSGTAPRWLIEWLRSTRHGRALGLDSLSLSVRPASAAGSRDSIAAGSATTRATQIPTGRAAVPEQSQANRFAGSSAKPPEDHLRQTNEV